jgi:hypothetical protein
LGENYSKSIDNQPKTTDEKEIEPA